MLTTDRKSILDKPQFREISSHIAVFYNYARVERAVESIILESYLGKLRNNVRYMNKGVYICVGINSDGHREILGARIYDSETEIQWELFFDDLKDRGLNGVELVISDGNKGIREAVKQSFPGSSWQYCHVHFMRNLRKLMGKQQWKDISLLIKQSLDNYLLHLI